MLGVVLFRKFIRTDFLDRLLFITERLVRFKLFFLSLRFVVKIRVVITNVSYFFVFYLLVRIIRLKVRNRLGLVVLGFEHGRSLSIRQTRDFCVFFTILLFFEIILILFVIQSQNAVFLQMRLLRRIMRLFIWISILFADLLRTL